MSKVPCPHGYVHDTSGPSPFVSLTSDRDWVCDRGEYGANLFAAQSAGIVVNGIIGMQLSDT